jgi:hypothetical protein
LAFLLPPSQGGYAGTLRHSHIRVIRPWGKRRSILAHEENYFLLEDLPQDGSLRLLVMV